MLSLWNARVGTTAGALLTAGCTPCGPFGVVSSSTDVSSAGAPAAPPSSLLTTHNSYRGSGNTTQSHAPKQQYCAAATALHTSSPRAALAVVSGSCGCAVCEEPALRALRRWRISFCLGDCSSFRAEPNKAESEDTTKLITHLCTSVRERQISCQHQQSGLEGPL